MTSPTNNGLFIVERILRDRNGVWRQISEQRDLPALLKQMLVSSMISLACYGAVLGSSKGWEQVLSSTVKLPVLFLATLAICLPTLYLFNLVFGARLMMSQAVSLIMVCITVTSVLTLAFAPISLFFRITAQSYAFFKLLNISILLLTAVVGLRFLTAGMQALNAYNERVALQVEAERQAREAAERQAREAAERAALQAETGHAALTAAPAVPGAPSDGDDTGDADDEAPAGDDTPKVLAATATTPNGGGNNGVVVESAPTTPQPAAPAPQPAAAARAMPLAPQPTPGAPVAPQPMPGAPMAAPIAPMVPFGPRIPAPRPAPAPERSASMTLLYVWILLFGFVGTQLAWTLRPFFGSPGEPFEVFRNIQGTFYGDVLHTIGRLLGS